MSKRIYVLIDHGNGQIRTPSLESLSLGRRLAEELGMSLHALVLGHEVQELAQQVAAKDADAVMLVQDPRLGQYDPDLYCEAMCQVLSQDCPYILLMGHIYQNIDLAPKLAARLNTALVTDCIGYRKQEETLLFVRQMFRNRLNADIRVDSAHPWIVTMQAGATSIDDVQEGRAEIVERSVDLSAVTQRRRSLKIFEAVKGKVDLSRAELIVAVGRGIRKAENLKIIEELAEELGAEIAASRPVVDNEWLDRSLNSLERGGRRRRGRRRVAKDAWHTGRSRAACFARSRPAHPGVAPRRHRSALHDRAGDRARVRGHISIHQ